MLWPVSIPEARSKRKEDVLLGGKFAAMRLSICSRPRLIRCYQMLDCLSEDGRYGRSMGGDVGSSFLRRLEVEIVTDGARSLIYEVCGRGKSQV